MPETKGKPHQGRTMRTEKEFKNNLAAYWRGLNAACGVPAGTHPDDPNPAVTNAAPFAVTSSDPPSHASYTDPGFDAVYASLINDPDTLALLQEHWNDSFIPNDLGPAPADPGEQLRWYILRDLNDFHHKRHKADFDDAKKHRTLQRTDRLLSKLNKHDPLYALTREVMDFYEEGLAPTALRAKRHTFERCPLEALGYYREMRRIASKVTTKRATRNLARYPGE
jgi:hypothetical protein